MDFAQSAFERDCLEAAGSDAAFDDANAEDIGAHHGRDPVDVIAAIQFIRTIRAEIQAKRNATKE